MTLMKPGKYAGATFTPEQNKARRMARRALEMRVTLADALMSGADLHTREYWHTRLDWYLNQIDRLNADSRELFPDVEESFTIASMTVKL